MRKLRNWCVSSLLLLSRIHVLAASQEEEQAQAFLCLKDERAAAAVLNEIPREKWSLSTYSLAVRASLSQGSEKHTLQLWKDYQDALSKEREDFAAKEEGEEILESLSWKILRQGMESHAESVRIQTVSTLGQCQDIRAVDLLLKALRDPSDKVRLAAVQTALVFRDEDLKKEIHRCSKEDPNWILRMQALRALGIIGVHESKEELLSFVKNEKALMEERGVAMESLVNLLEDVDLEGVISLAKSPHAPLRLLACLVIDYFQLKEGTHLLTQMAQKDPQRDVKLQALISLGHLQADFEERALENKDPTLACLTSWVYFMSKQEGAEEYLESFLLHTSAEVQMTAAGAILASGEKGISLARQHVLTHPNAMVRLNLCYALLLQRTEVEKASGEMQKILRTTSSRLCWREGIGELKHLDLLSSTRGQIEEDLAVRGELMELLLIVGEDKVMAQLRETLRQGEWGISLLAAESLLRYGNEGLQEELRTCLRDVERRVRVQAALILLYTSDDEQALEVLIEEYEQSPRKDQQAILQAIGQSGNRSSLPFLLKRLESASQSLRVQAAAAVLQVLYG